MQCWLGHLDGARRKLSCRERVARMYAPEVTPRRLGHLTSDAASDPGEINQAIKRYGVIVTRTAMNASGAHFGNREITATRNDGINEFIVVLRRANYILPSGAGRSFPLLSGRAVPD